MATAAERLVEAEAAYHRLMIGGQVVEIVDQNGEKGRYSMANASRLWQYILALRAEIAGDPGVTKPPMRPLFA